MKKKGFTLIELLVVISVIALLIAILVPVLRRAREQARRILCGSNQRSIVVAMSTYAVSNNGNVPRSCDYLRAEGHHSQVFARLPTIWDNEELVEAMLPYLGILDVVTCPSAKSTIKYNGDTKDFAWNHWSSPFLWLPGLTKITGSAQFFEKNPSPAPSEKMLSAPPSKLLLVDINIVWVPRPGPNWGVQSNHAFGGRVTYLDHSEVSRIFIGSNRAYVDTHVEWVTPKNMGRDNGPVTNDPFDARYSFASNAGRPMYW